MFTGNLAIVQNHGQTVTALVGRALKAAGDIARSVQMLNCIAVCIQDLCIGVDHQTAKGKMIEILHLGNNKRAVLDFAVEFSTTEMAIVPMPGVS